MSTDKSVPVPPESGTNGAVAAETVAEQQLDTALRRWHQHSKQQHRLDNAQRLALQQLVLQEKPLRRSGHWQRGVQQMVALAACVLVLVVWLTPPELMYQIEQQQQGLYTIQIHQLAPALDLHQSAPAAPAAPAPTAAQQRQQQYQLVYQDYLRSQQQVARTVSVWRESTADGWQLQSCDHLQVQVQADLLAALKQQQADQQQWQLLEQSRYLLLTTGAQGQILALKPAVEAPHCAI